MDIIEGILDWLAIVFGAIALYFSIKRKWKKFFPIQLYIIISLCVNLFLQFNNRAFSKPTSGLISYIVSAIYSILEITLMYYFFRVNITSRKLKIAIWITFGIFFSMFPIFLYKPVFGYDTQVYGVESLFVVIASLFYFFEKLNSELSSDLKSDPVFISACGILVYFGISTPCFLYARFWENIGLVRLLDIINLFFYAILFVSFIKAYLCPYQESKQ